MNQKKFRQTTLDLWYTKPKAGEDSKVQSDTQQNSQKKRKIDESLSVPLHTKQNKKKKKTLK